MEQTLGSVTHYLNLRRHEAEADGLQPVWAPVDFTPGRLPWALRGSMAARRVLGRLRPDVDGLFIHTTTIALLANAYLRRLPTVISTDATAANKDGFRAHYGLRPEGRLVGRIKRSVYRRAFRLARRFVVWCEWARASLVEHYGCRAADVTVIPPGTDLETFRPGTRRPGLPRLLFVGGDLRRKGGDTLLDVFHQRLRGRAELEIVTGTRLDGGPGVRVHNGLGPNSPELVRLFAECDAFVLPTLADCLPLAIMEALAAGLPVVATDVGALAELVTEGRTGYLVPRSEPRALGEALERVVTDATRREAMARAARSDAEERFDVRRNARRLFEVVGAALAPGEVAA